MLTPEDYERWNAERKEADFNRARAILAAAGKGDPDQYAADVRLARARGVPTGVAAQARQSLQDPISATMHAIQLSRSPKLFSSFTDDPDFAGVAFDDVPCLATIEEFAQRSLLPETAPRTGPVPPRPEPGAQPRSPQEQPGRPTATEQSTDVTSKAPDTQGQNPPQPATKTPVPPGATAPDRQGQQPADNSEDGSGSGPVSPLVGPTTPDNQAPDQQPAQPPQDLTTPGEPFSPRVDQTLGRRAPGPRPTEPPQDVTAPGEPASPPAGPTTPDSQAPGQQPAQSPQDAVTSRSPAPNVPAVETTSQPSAPESVQSPQENSGAGSLVNLEEAEAPEVDDPADDFLPNATEFVKGIPEGVVSTVGLAVEGVGYLVSPSSDWRTIAEEIAAAKGQPEEYIRALSEKIKNQDAVDPQVATELLYKVLFGSASKDDVIAAFQPVWQEKISNFLIDSGDSVNEYGKTIFTAAPGMENSWGRKSGVVVGQGGALLVVGATTGGTAALVLGGAVGAGEAGRGAREAGKDRDTQHDAAGWGFLVSSISIGPAGKLIREPAKAGASTLLRRYGWGAIAGGADGAIGQVGQNLIASNYYDPSRSVLQDAGLAIVVGSSLGAVGQTVAGRASQKEEAAAKAETTTAQIDEVATLSAESKSRLRDVEAFRQFVGMTVEGKPVENLYVPADKLRDHFQSSGVDPDTFFADVPEISRQDYDVALSSGGDVKLPTATYAARLVGSNHDSFLRQNMKFDPDGMTGEQAREYQARNGEILQQAKEEANTIQRQDMRLLSHEKLLQEQMVAHLTAAGHPVDAARKQAMALPAYYRTMAKFSGMAGQEPPKASASPKGAARPVDAEAPTATPADLRGLHNGKERDKSLRDFVNERGGIRASDAATDGAASGANGADAAKAADGPVPTAPDIAAKAADPSVAVEADKGRDTATAAEADASKAAGATVLTSPKAADAKDVDASRPAGTTAARDAAPSGAAKSDSDSPAGTMAPIGAGAKDADASAPAGSSTARPGGGMMPTSPEAAVAKDEDASRTAQPAKADASGKAAPTGLSLDEMARAAVDNGHMADNPVVQEWKRATAAGEPAPDLKPVFLEELNRETAGGTGPRNNAAPAVPKAGHSVQRQRIADAVPVRRARNRDQARKAAGNFQGKPIANAETGLVAIVPRDNLAKLLGAKAAAKSTNAGEHAQALANVDMLLKNAVVESKADGVTTLVAPMRVGKQSRLVTMRVKERQSKGEAIHTLETVEVSAPAAKWVDATIQGDGLDPTSTLSTGAPKSLAQDIADFNAASAPLFGLPKSAETSPDQGAKAGGGTGIGAASLPLVLGGLGSGAVMIGLLENADRETFIEQSGDMFLSMTKAFAEAPGASTDIAGMFADVKGWWRTNAADVARDAAQTGGLKVSAADVQRALDEGTSGDAKLDAAIDAGMQEQFARGFEAYIMEGKSPSAELRSAFERYRAWLLDVGGKAGGMGTQLTPEIRKVFDRMLATDAELLEQRSMLGDQMMFSSPEEAGMSAADHARLMKLHQKSQDEGAQRLLKHTMAPLHREQQQWFKDERANVRDEASRKIDAQKQYVASEWLANRHWLGEGEPVPEMSLSRDMLVERYGTGILALLPQGSLAIHAESGGVDPDEAAGWFGFGSGDEMIKAMVLAPPRERAIEAQTDKVMRDRHGDVLADGSVEQAAVEAIHGDERGAFLAAELAALRNMAGDTAPAITPKEAKRSARASLAQMSVRDATDARRFLAAERRAATEGLGLAYAIARRNGAQALPEPAAAATAAQGTPDQAGQTILGQAMAGQAMAGQASEAGAPDKAAGKAAETAKAEDAGAKDNLTRLVEAKRRQLVNHALYAESVKIAEEVKEAELFAARFTEPSLRDKLGGAYLGAADDIVERYGFAAPQVGQQYRHGTLKGLIARMSAEGRERELAIPDHIAETQRRPYRQLSVENLGEVVDALRNIEHMAARETELVDARSTRDRDAVIGAVAANIAASATPAVMVGKAVAAQGHFDPELNATALLRQIDGGKQTGAAQINIKAPLDQARLALADRRLKASADIEALYGVYSPAERRAMAVRQAIPGFAQPLSKWQGIAIALNAGNETNYRRMTDKAVADGPTPGQVDVVLASLDRRDWDFVQGAWDYLESFAPDIAARERRATGVDPQWVEPRPIRTRFGTYRGGYYPLHYVAQPDGGGDSIVAALTGGRTAKAQTKNGHLRQAAASPGQGLELDIGVLHRHVERLVADLEFSEPVANATTILKSRGVGDALSRTGRNADVAALEA